MSRRDWLVPLVIGLVAAGGAALWPKAPPPPETHLVAPFPTAQGEAGQTYTNLLVATMGPAPVGGGVRWHARVGLVGGTYGAACDESVTALECGAVEPLVRSSLAPPGPRFGRDGRNATRATVYIFLDDGSLLASNADVGNASRFVQNERFIALGHPAWYLGNATRPAAGTEPLPASVAGVLRQVRPLLVGVAPGGVASVAIDQYPGSLLLGTLYVTVRVDSLVDAP